MTEQPIEKQPSKIAKWVKRFGFWGIMFFVIKGLLVLLISALIAYFSVS